MRIALILTLAACASSGGAVPDGGTADLAGVIVVPIVQNGGSPACVPAGVNDATTMCTVVDARTDGTITPLPACAQAAPPCWSVSAATTACPRGAFGVTRDVPPPGTTSEALCSTR